MIIRTQYPSPERISFDSLTMSKSQ